MKKKHHASFLPNGMHAPKKTICFAAGHSGGHITPCITLAETTYKQNRILFFTTAKPLDTALIKNSSRSLEHIALPISQKRAWYSMPLIALSLAWATAKSMWHLCGDRPEKIITTGSIVALPVCIAGFLLRIPIELFELNATAGRTIKMLAPLATTLLHCFAELNTAFARSECQYVPYPIRFTSPGASHPVSDTITILVLGGSQGSQEMNECMKQFVAGNATRKKLINLKIMHQVGMNAAHMQAIYDAAALPADVFCYDHDLSHRYQAADIILCRAGAGTLFEALHFQKTIIALPLMNQAHQHQLHNAIALQTAYPELCTVARSPQEAWQLLDHKIALLQNIPKPATIKG